MHEVAIVTVPNMMSTHIAGVYEFLSAVPNLWAYMASSETSNQVAKFDISITSFELGPVACYNNFQIMAQRTLEQLNTADIVILPGFFDPKMSTTTLSPPLIKQESRLLEWVKQRHQEGALVMAIGSGNYFLAQAGLLDGGDATSHWACHEPLRRLFPQVNWRNGEAMCVNPQRPNVLSVGGGAAWYDGAREIICRFVSAADATNAAKAYNVFNPSSDGRLYTEFLPVKDHADAIIEQVQAWLAAHYMGKNLVTQVEANFPLSPRTLKRRFNKATGFTLIDYIHQLRLQQAKLLLEQSSLTIDSVSLHLGYNEVSYFRRLFIKHLGMTPQQYRQRYNTTN